MDDVTRLIAYRKRQDRVFQVVGGLCTLIGIATLVTLLAKLGYDGLPLLIPRNLLAIGEWLAVRLGSLLVMALSIAVPLGLGAAIYLETSAQPHWLINRIATNISYLTRTPWILYGLAGLVLIGHVVGGLRSTLAGGLTLALLILPLIVLKARAALSATPSTGKVAPAAPFGSEEAGWGQLVFRALAGVLPVARPLLAVVAIAALVGVMRYVDFFFWNASYLPEESGILMAWVGSLCVMAVTFLSAVPLGVAAAVYLEEYARRNWFTDFIEVNISNLAGIPSITYGLMALWLFGYILGLSSSVLVGGLTLALLILPIIIVATREALRSIPNAIREAAYAAGATKWQTIWYHMLPYSLGGIATGTIIAMSRAVGETAPLIVIGAAGWISNLPPSPVTSRFPFFNLRWLNADFTVLPIQMFTWTADPDPSFQKNAAAAGLVLIAFTLTMNAVAIVVRYRVRKKLKW